MVDFPFTIDLADEEVQKNNVRVMWKAFQLTDEKFNYVTLSDDDERICPIGIALWFHKNKRRVGSINGWLIEMSVIEITLVSG